MKNLLFVAAVLFAGSACQKNERTGKEADHQADRVKDNANDLREESRDIAEVANDRFGELREEAADNARDIADEAKDVGEQAMDLEDAQNEFEYARMVRVATLRGVQSVVASQTAVINAFATTPQEREKLQILQMRVDEAGNEIQALQGVPATTWEQRHDDVKQAMSRLEDARDDAWDALDDDDRLDRTSMR
jgi:hypothetical protein